MDGCQHSRPSGLSAAASLSMDIVTNDCCFVLQDSGFQGAQAAHVARCAADVLVRMNRLPSSYASRSTRLLPMFLRRVQLVGRELELCKLQEVLQTQTPAWRRVLLLGGPGDGKTELAHAAGAVLYDQGLMPSGVFAVDLASELTHTQKTNMR